MGIFPVTKILNGLQTKTLFGCIFLKLFSISILSILILKDLCPFTLKRKVLCFRFELSFLLLLFWLSIGAEPRVPDAGTKPTAAEQENRRRDWISVLFFSLTLWTKTWKCRNGLIHQDDSQQPRGQNFKEVKYQTVNERSCSCPPPYGVNPKTLGWNEDFKVVKINKNEWIQM